MNWITDNAMWVAGGLIVFLAIFIIAFLARNQSAKTDTTGAQEKQSEESNIGIKNSRK